MAEFEPKIIIVEGESGAEWESMQATEPIEEGGVDKLESAGEFIPQD